MEIGEWVPRRLDVATLKDAGAVLRRQLRRDGLVLKCFWVGPVGTPLSYLCPTTAVPLSRHFCTSVMPLLHLCHATVAPLQENSKGTKLNARTRLKFFFTVINNDHLYFILEKSNKVNLN